MHDRLTIGSFEVPSKRAVRVAVDQADPDLTSVIRSMLSRDETRTRKRKGISVSEENNKRRKGTENIEEKGFVDAIAVL